METQTKLNIVSLIIIAILGSSVGYLIVQKHRILKSAHQFIIASSVQTYQSLDRGEIDSLKQRTGTVAAFQSSEYERLYGHETGTKFASVLEDAKVIRDKIASK